VSEQRFDVKQVGIRYICDECDTGEMLPHGKPEWLAEPVQFPHKCNHCGHEQAFGDRYPKFVWELV
jgi:hypothetical protein